MNWHQQHLLQSGKSGPTWEVADLVIWSEGRWAQGGLCFKQKGVLCRVDLLSVGGTFSSLRMGMGHRMEITWRADLWSLSCLLRFYLPGFFFWVSLTSAMQCHSLLPVPWASEMDRTGQFFQNPDCLWWGDGAVGPGTFPGEGLCVWDQRVIEKLERRARLGWVVTVAFELPVANLSAAYSLFKHSMVNWVWVCIWTRTTNQCSVSKLCLLQLCP